MSEELTFDVKDLRRFEKTLERMGGVPQKAATKAASKGLTEVRREVRKLVPVGRTKNLKRGLYRKGEKHRQSGKKVYQLTFDPSMNDVFQKPIKYTGLYGGQHLTHAYYPNSVEFGFLTRKKGGGLEYREFTRKAPGRKKVKYGVTGYESRKVEGQHFMERGAIKAAPAATNKMADTLIKEVTKEWTKD